MIIFNFNNSKKLNYYVDEWLNNKSNIKLSSYTRYYNLINEHIKNDIGKLSINKINTNIVNEYLTRKLNTGKINGCGGLSKNTVYDIKNILMQVFKKNNIDIDLIKINKKIGKGKCLYNNDRKKLLSYLINNENTINIGILLSLLLGLRKSEVCGIKWNDIDLNNKVIKINNIISRVNSFDDNNKTKLIISSPKTDNSKRILPIPNKLLIILKKFKCNNNYFLLTSNNTYMDPRTFYNHYKKITNSLNINYTYHDLRHTFATNCIELGIDSKTLMELLGHANISTTLNIYVHPSINSKRRYIDKL